MRKLKLMLGPDTSIEVSTGWVRDLKAGKLGSLYFALDRLGFGILVVFAALFPLLDVRASVSDSTYAYHLLLVVTALVGLALGLVILTRWQRVSDPPIFLPVLGFAFLVLIAFLIVPASAANTFGVVGAKYLSGVMVMAFAALYYLTNMFTNSSRKLKWLVKAVMIALLLMVISPILAQNSGGMLFPAAVLAVPVFLFYFLRAGSNLLKAVAFVAVVAGTWAAFQPDSDLFTKIAVLVGIFITSLSWLSSLGWQIKKPWATFRSDWNNFMENKITLPQLLESSTILLVAVFWVVWLVLTLIWVNTNQIDFARQFNTVVTEIRSAVNVLEGTELFTGVGAGMALREVSLANLIRYQGLLGVAAYTVLTVSGFYLLMTGFLRGTSKQGDLVLVYAPFLFGLPVLALIGSATLPMVILWWIMLAVVSSRISLPEKPRAVELFIPEAIRGFKLGKAAPYLQAALIIVIVIVWYYLAGSIQTLYNSGII